MGSRCHVDKIFKSIFRILINSLYQWYIENIIRLQPLVARHMFEKQNEKLQLKIPLIRFIKFQYL